MEQICPRCLHPMCAKCMQLTIAESYGFNRCCNCKGKDTARSWLTVDKQRVRNKNKFDPKKEAPKV